MKISIERLKEIIMEEAAKAASVEEGILSEWATAHCQEECKDSSRDSYEMCLGACMQHTGGKEPPVKEDLYPLTEIEGSLNIEIVDDE